MPNSDCHESNLASQMDEIELLNSMYPEDLTVHSDLGEDQQQQQQQQQNQSLDIRISDGDGGGDGGKGEACSLHLRLGPGYPSEGPPIYELSGHFLSREEKREIQGLMGEND